MNNVAEEDATKKAAEVAAEEAKKKAEKDAGKKKAAEANKQAGAEEAIDGTELARTDLWLITLTTDGFLEARSLEDKNKKISSRRHAIDAYFISMIKHKAQ